MTCRVCQIPGRVTDEQAIGAWAGFDPVARAQTLHYFNSRDIYEAARNARGWSTNWMTDPNQPCTFCRPEQVAPPVPARPRTPPRPRANPLPRPSQDDLQASARLISERAQSQQEDTTETLADKLKRTMNLAGDALHGTSDRLSSVVDAGQRALQARIDAQTQTAQELAQAGERMAQNIAEAGRDAAHTLRTAGEEIAFAHEQESRIRRMCRNETLEAGFRCASDLREGVASAGIDDVINVAADVAIAGATRSVKNFAKVESIRGAAAILKRPNCREFIRGSVSNSCVDRLLPRGYVNVSTETPRRRDENAPSSP